MRGKVLFQCSAAHVKGITPAYAGKSTSMASWLKPLGDHPRVCGEKNIVYRAVGILQGSPPRMRGKESSLDQLSGRFRITPAYAGKSFHA